MAHARPIPEDMDEQDPHTDCGICLSEMENPKALLCLHSFCLECLRTYSASKPLPHVIHCPLCREETPLPPGGVDRLRNNFLIIQLKERRAIGKMGVIKKSCSSCEATDREVVARCMECNGFICPQCNDLHKTIAMLKSHSVVTIEELRSEKIDIRKVIKEECCQLHKDQVLRWFCKTCGVPICRDCTVMDHRHPAHDYVTLESVAGDQKSKIKQLLESCKGISQKIDTAMKDAEKVKTELKGSLAGAREKLDKTKEQVKNAFLKALEKNYQSNTKKINKLEAERCEKIDKEKRDLHNLQSKLNNAMKIANQVIQSGSQSDVACNYSSLTNTLTQLRDKQVCHTRGGFRIVRFKPNQQSLVIGSVDLGSVILVRSWDGHSHWNMVKDIGHMEDGEDNIKGGVGIAISPKGDIVIADDEGMNVKVFDLNGKLKQVLDQGDLDTPNDVTVSSTGMYYVTDLTPYVKVYHPNGDYHRKFPIKSPSGTSSVRVKGGARLCSIAIDKQDNLWVGCSNMKYVSKHQQDGQFISAFKVGTRPEFIAVTTDRVIVSPYSQNTGAQVLDHTGNLIHTINGIPDNDYWWPSGVCCIDSVIFISSFDYGSKGGIYSFTMEGEYKGCVTTLMSSAHGIAFTEDDKLVLVQGYGDPARVFAFK